MNDPVEAMIARVEEEGVRDPRVLAAMRRVPRECFVPEPLMDDAYEDYPLPLGRGLTLPQPSIVAVMTELARVRASDRVLEIGTGSGYQAAVLHALGAEVHTIERRADFVRRARRTLARAGAGQVHVHHGDGALGLPNHAPYDVIIGTAAPLELPTPWIAQLADGGRIVTPLGGGSQQLLRWTREGDELRRDRHGSVAFMALVSGVPGD